MESLRQAVGMAGGAGRDGTAGTVGEGSGIRAAEAKAPPRGRRLDAVEARLCVGLAAVAGLFVLLAWRGLSPSSPDLVAVPLPSATTADVAALAGELRAAGVRQEVRFGVLYVNAEDAPRVVERYRSGRKGHGAGEGGDPPASATEAPGSY